MILQYSIDCRREKEEKAIKSSEPNNDEHRQKKQCSSQKKNTMKSRTENKSNKRISKFRNLEVYLIKDLVRKNI